MLSEICREIKNWFEQSKHIGVITIHGGMINYSGLNIAVGQYFRIVGSVFNDGIYKYTGEAISELVDETFDGAVWLLAIPKEIITLSKDIDDWKAKYMTADSVNMSPFQSESFGGYSYSKKSGGNGNGDGAYTWQSAFANQLNQWRKI